MKKLISTKTILLSVLGLILELVSLNAVAQMKITHDSLYFRRQKETKINYKQYIVPVSSVFISGMIDGTIESMKFHYDNGFKPHFKGINDQFWNPELSWKNKYKNGNKQEGEKFRGSTNALVFTTDAYHALRTAKNLVNTFSLVFYINKAKGHTITKTTLKKVLVDALVFTAVRNIGFTATYGVLFKQK